MSETVKHSCGHVATYDTKDASPAVMAAAEASPCSVCADKMRRTLGRQKFNRDFEELWQAYRKFRDTLDLMGQSLCKFPPTDELENRDKYRRLGNAMLDMHESIERQFNDLPVEDLQD